MNNARRKEINTLIAELEDLKSRLESVLEEEQEYLDNMPESFQGGEKGEKAQSAIFLVNYPFTYYSFKLFSLFFQSSFKFSFTVLLCYQFSCNI